MQYCSQLPGAQVEAWFTDNAALWSRYISPPPATHPSSLRPWVMHHGGWANTAAWHFSTPHSWLWHCQTHANWFVPSKWSRTAAAVIMWLCVNAYLAYACYSSWHREPKGRAHRVFTIRIAPLIETNRVIPPPGMRKNTHAQRKRENKYEVTHAPLGVCKF